jgi:hypothetical protein
MIRKTMLCVVVLSLASIVVRAQSSDDIGPSEKNNLPVVFHDNLKIGADPRASLPIQRVVPKKTNLLPAVPHEKFATFLAGADFKSVLLLENLRPDLPITFTPSLILGATEVPLDSVTVPAHTTATVDINAALTAHTRNDSRGTVSVRFDFNSYGPGSAVVEMRDDKHQVFLNSYAQSSEEYWTGTGYDAVVWAPQDGTQGFISVINSSDETHRVNLTFLVNGRSEPQAAIQIPARQTRIIPIDDLLMRGRKSGAGIHVEYTQGTDEKYTGAILVEGQLFNRKTGFAKHIHFIDKDLQYPTGTLRTHFLLLGKQPTQDNFPSDVSFRSVAAFRNVDTVPVAVTPTIKFLQSGFLQTLSLPAKVLAPGESSTIDFNEEQRTGHLPLDFTQGSLDLTPDTGRTSIVAELFNFNATGNYVVGPSFNSYPNRSTGSIWRTDGSFQTTIMIENTASQDDQVTLKLYSDQSTYQKTFNITAGNLLKINVRDLQQNSIPDDHGNLLSGTQGVLNLAGSHSTKSQLVYDKIIHSADQADYVGLPISPCDFVASIFLFLASTSVMPNAVMKAYEWTISGEEDIAAGGSTVSNSSLAQISNNGSGDMVTFTPPNDGQTHFVSIGPDLPEEDVTFCDACSAGDVFVSGISNIGIRHTFTVYKNPTENVLKDVCQYFTTACNAGTTPTCISGFGISLQINCPNFAGAVWIVVDDECEFGFYAPVSGPGNCS